MKLVPEDPFASDDVGAGWTRNKVPRVVGEQGGELILHCRPPMRIGEGGAVCAGNRREWRSVEVEACSRTVDANLAASHHGVVVEDGGDSELCRRRPNTGNAGTPGARDSAGWWWSEP